MRWLNTMVAVALGGCATTTVPEVSAVTRMSYAAARGVGCDLTFVHAPVAEMSPLGRYDVLGYVTVRQRAAVDPYDEAAIQLVRPIACRLGGTAVSITISSTSYGEDGNATVSAYAVLRDKAARASP